MVSRVQGKDMRILLIECGNTRCKWAQFQNNKVTAIASRAYDEFSNGEDLVAQLMACGPFDHIVVASVIETPLLRQAWDALQGHGGGMTRLASPLGDDLNITVAYARPENLGIDRHLAMIASLGLSEGPKCVVDCGTATTVDVVTADGQHLGGQILPGLELMRESLHHGTKGLPKYQGEQPFSLLGRDTLECIGAGTLAAQAGAINLVLDQITQFGDLHGIITGGDAADILPWLKGRWEHRPNLVLEGMAEVCRSRLIGDGL